MVAWTAAFLVVAGIIAFRDRSAFRAQERYDVLGESLQVVSRQHDQFSAEIADRLASGPLTALGERLGLRSPSDTEIETVPVPGP